MEVKDQIPDGPYTVRQLIEALQKCENQDAPVFVYLLDSSDGVGYDPTGRYPVTFVDDTFDKHRMVDLNVSSDWPDLIAGFKLKEEQDACTENN